MTSSINIPDLGLRNFSSTVMYQRAYQAGAHYMDQYHGQHPISIDEIVAVLGTISKVVISLREYDKDGHVLLERGSEEGGDLSLCQIDTYSGSSLQHFTVAAMSPDIVEMWMAAIKDLLPPPPPPPEPVPFQMPLNYWMMGPMGPENFSRTVDSQPWDVIRGNYPASVREQVDPLATLTNFEGGKIILAHGPPGTGKTRATLGLVETWRQWADVHVITDPEDFFRAPNYMINVIMGFDTDSWNILVIEDGDEFMDAADTGSKSQSVGRLLNLNDGFIGQGLKVATFISTNVNLASFNSAVTRPGRCLANIEFPSFDADEANEWLGVHGLSTDSAMTLAEMFEAARRAGVVLPENPPAFSSTTTSDPEIVSGGSDELDNW